MNLIRYSTRRSTTPTFNYGVLLNELDRLFQAGLQAEPALSWRSGPFPVDVFQNKDAVIVRAELPGFRKEDLEINVADAVLAIVGHVKEGDTKETPKADASFERKVGLPDHLDYQKVTAAFEDGVLTVTLPKREEAKPTTIAVEIK